MSFLAKIKVDENKFGPACGPFDFYSCTDGTGIYGENCAANQCNEIPFLVDIPSGDNNSGLFAESGFTFTAPSPLTKVVKIKSKGVCTGITINVCIIGIPTPTPTPTPSPTPTATPTATPTLTPTPPPTNTPTPTPTPSPTPTPTPGCDFNGNAVYGNTLPTPTPNPTSTPTVTPTATAVGPTPTPNPTVTPTPTATPNPTVTPTATPTVTPDPTPTPFETTFSGYVSLNNGPSACSGGEYAAVNVTVRGTSLCTLTKVLGLSSPTYGNVYSDMIVDDTFWVSNGTDEREFKRDGSAQTGTAQTSCTSCSNPPTPTPEPTPTQIPSTYDVYQRCDLTAIYYVNYSAGNLNTVTINSECCSKISTNVDDAYMLDNYSSAIFFSTYTNSICPCD